MKARLHKTFTADFILRSLLARPLLAGPLTWNRQRLIPFPSITGYEFYFRRNHYECLRMHTNCIRRGTVENPLSHPLFVLRPGANII